MGEMGKTNHNDNISIQTLQQQAFVCLQIHCCKIFDKNIKKPLSWKTACKHICQ